MLCDIRPRAVSRKTRVQRDCTIYTREQPNYVVPNRRYCGAMRLSYVREGDIIPEKRQNVTKNKPKMTNCREHP